MEKEISVGEKLIAILVLLFIPVFCFFVGRWTINPNNVLTNVKVDCDAEVHWNLQKIKGTEVYGQIRTKVLVCSATNNGNSLSGQIFYKSQDEINAMFK